MAHNTSRQVAAIPQANSAINLDKPASALPTPAMVETDSSDLVEEAVTTGPAVGDTNLVDVSKCLLVSVLHSPRAVSLVVVADGSQTEMTISQAEIWFTPD